MKSNIKFIAAASGLILICSAAHAQQTDSVIIQNPSSSSMSVSPETVVIADTLPTTSGAQNSSYFSGTGGETETIHVYSGSQDGNNIIRTYEVPLPPDSPRRNYKPY
jgi:hypothetical protein